MAGDWIKMRVALTYDLKVMQIARTLNGNQSFIEQLAPECRVPTGGCNAHALHTFVIGALHRFWCATQEMTTDGNLRSLEANDIDCLVGCFGFCEALIDVGWLEVLEDGRLQVHNWHEHNGESAKKRAMSQKRTEKHRKVKRASVTREEKRREEKSIEESKSSARTRTFVKPTLAEVTAYCRERQNAVSPQAFLDHYESNGWRVGRNPMKDWKAAVRTWEKNEGQFGGLGGGGSNRPGRGVGSPARIGTDPDKLAAYEAKTIRLGEAEAGEYGDDKAPANGVAEPGRHPDRPAEDDSWFGDG